MNNIIIDDVCQADMKICSSCGKEKSLTKGFYYKVINKERRCKECVSKLRKEHYKKNPHRQRLRANIYRQKNPEKVRDTKLKQAYGVGVDYFNKKLIEQNGVCAGCRRNKVVKWRGKEVNMALDHDHKTNTPRGVLCIKCNRALGLLEENIDSFLNLIDYINKYQK